MTNELHAKHLADAIGFLYLFGWQVKGIPVEPTSSVQAKDHLMCKLGELRFLTEDFLHSLNTHLPYERKTNPDD